MGRSISQSYLGTRQVPHVQEGLADAIGYVETLRALVYEAERNPVPSASGLALPNPTQITIARIFGVVHTGATAGLAGSRYVPSHGPAALYVALDADAAFRELNQDFSARPAALSVGP